ncbi:1-acyl-sn-glycerol-3-phosphate acyltransferase [uncultured Thiohalocapsa sp.]|uniref:lysophospholipid acyltransferase family protein n=1 Tax=uncultured Thiohalocapsa sp. TaxID=768990 RepID=UPI0025F31786|nr:lysophospholipid acyltransferase family protein [uncultured Thiohalocapsa sp.]
MRHQRAAQASPDNVSASTSKANRKRPASASIRLRSLIFVVLSAALAVLHAPLVFLVAPFLSFEQRYRFVNVWSLVVMWLLRHLNGVHIEVEGRAHIPRDRGVVLMPNHQSPWETFYLQLLVSPQATILKKELLWIPFFGWGLALLKPIAINRSMGSQALKTILREGAARLAEGISVTIFPEGTRQPPGTIGRFSSGGAMLATRTGADVLPVAHNSGDCWPARSLMRYPGTIRVVIGEPIASRGKTAKALTAEVEQWIHAHYPVAAAPAG